MEADYSSSILISWHAAKKLNFRFLWNFEFFGRYFYFASITFGDFFCLFWDDQTSLKQDTDHNH